MAKFSLILISIFVTLVGFTWDKPKHPERIVIEVPEPQRNFKEHLKDAARAYGVPESIAAAMVWQESRGRMDSIRYEPGQVERAKKLSRASGESLRMYASSHCSLQIMGWHTPALGLTWSDLYDPKTCAEVGMKIMGDCLNRHRDKDPMTRTMKGLTCYNGSEEYAKAILNRLGQKLLESHIKEAIRG